MIRHRKPLLLLLAALLLSSCQQYHVYSVRENPVSTVGGGVLYALPVTRLCVQLTLEQRDFSSAPYRDYAAEYLGIDTAQVNDAVRLRDIRVKSVNVADKDNFYYVRVKSGSVTVDARHLLLAVGRSDAIESALGAVATESSPQAVTDGGRLQAQNTLYDRTDTLYGPYDAPGRPTVVSSKRDHRTLRQRAASAARRLEEIQEKQRQLLDGEYEGNYTQEMVQYLYNRLREQEEQIVAEFCGSVRQETVELYYDPPFHKLDAVVDTLAWFSPREGLFTGDSSNAAFGAVPVVCTVKPGQDLRNADRFVRRHTSSSNYRASKQKYNHQAFRYRVPEKAAVVIQCGDYSMSCELPFAQLGPVLEMPSQHLRALFDPTTLELIYMDRKHSGK